MRVTRIKIIIFVLIVLSIFCERKTLEYNKITEHQIQSEKTSEFSVEVPLIPTTEKIYIRAKSNSSDILTLPILSVFKGSK
jgi:hypothetical protein